MYNLTNVTNANNIYEITSEINTLTGGLYGAFFVSAVFLICFIVMKNYDTKTVFLTASFITSIISGIMYFLKLISMSVLILPVILLFVSILIKVFSDD